MDIIPSYKYLMKNWVKYLGITFAIIFGINLITNILALVVFGENFTVEDLYGIIPFASPFILTIIIYIFGIFTKDSLLMGNQFGKSRNTMYTSHLMMLITLSVFCSLLLFCTDLIFNVQQRFFSDTYVKLPRLIYASYHALQALFAMYIATTLSMFISALWNRLNKLYRVVVFVGLPVLFVIAIPKIIINTLTTYEAKIRFLQSFLNFFGISQSRISYPRLYLTSLIYVVPLFVIAYLALQKAPLYGKKK